MGQRVLATEAAKQAATKMQALLTGDMTAQIKNVQTIGNQLCNPNAWDGPLAQRFRTGEWPGQSKALQSAVTTLETLSKQMETVVENILHAGGSN
ncbi:MAG: pyrophosphorylase [Chloroflexi bacterium]|jgi:hypothetical protein|nr:MAG: pyrophosphorylase [Chloroflexota bacterium]